jgi:MSHA pilin protein MshC
MNARGFTLVELITVMVVIGILAVAALPRFFDQNVFEARGFLDETRALLSYAQKTAVAQRRTVCVALGAGGVALTIANLPNVNVCNTALVLPSVPRGGAGLVSSVAAFQFRSTGATDQAANITITVTGATATITVDPTTGHVR